MSQTRLNVAQLKTLGRDNIATDSELAIAIGEHVLDTNPHPQYLEASSNIADSNALSCVELVRTILQGQKNYENDFANFEALIKKYKNLSPQMIFDCGDFDIIYLVDV